MKSFFVILSILIFGCRHQKLSSDSDLNNYINDEDNGLTKIVNQDGFTLTMRYKPAQLVAKQQLIRGTKREYDSLVKYYSKYIYFNLEISKNGKDLETKFGSDLHSFPDKISYLSNEFSSGIQLVADADTLELSDFLYSRSYGVSTSNFMLVFNHPKGQNWQIVVTSEKLGFGTVVFTFTQSDVENIPEINTKL